MCRLLGGISGVLHLSSCSFSFFRRLMVVRTVTAGAVASCQQPPAMTFLQALHFQIPPATRLTLVFPQKLHRYRACCRISMRFVTFRSEAPYRVPYFPVMPTFFVRFAISLKPTQCPPAASSPQQP